MKEKELDKLLDKLNLNKNSIKNDIKLLPKRYQKEFIEDVLVDENSLITFNKVYSYYLDEIWEELTIKEKNKMEKDIFIIQMRY